MPMPLRPCGPNCPELVIKGKCPAHTADAQRPSASARGYDRRWRTFRKTFLLELAIKQGRPLAECEDCRDAWENRPKDGKPYMVAIRFATDVHHAKKVRDFPHLRFVKSNCRGLCDTCHKVRTARGE